MQARAALKRYACQFPADEHLLFEAGISELEGTLRKATSQQLAAAHRLGEDGSYFALFLGLLQLRTGEMEAGHKTLQAFGDQCDSNLFPCRRIITPAARLGSSR